MRKNLQYLLRTEIDPAFAKRAETILNWINTARPRKVLDAGCGRGFYINALQFFPFIKEIKGCDVNENYLKIAKKNAVDQRTKITRASIYALPYPNSYFDCVISSEVLEHLENDSGALKELKRVLKPKGHILITVPNKNFPFLWDPLNWLLMKVFHTHVNKNIWWLAGIWADHERLYSPKEIADLIKKSKLKIEKMQLVLHWCWPFSHFLLYGIGKNVIERLGLQSFNRFNYRKNNHLPALLASFMKAPDRYLDEIFPVVSSVNIVITALNE